MKTRFLFLLLAGILPITALSLGPSAEKYAVNAIHPSLLKNANAIVRESDETLEIVNRGKAQYAKTWAITVLNKQGTEEAALVIFYDKLNILGSISGAVYDADGKQIKRLSKADFSDYSAFGGSTLFADNRVRYYMYESSTYPYTVEVSYDLTLDGTLFLPDFMPMEGNKVAVQHARYRLKSRTENEVKFKECNLTSPRIKRQDKDKVEYIWEVNNRQWTEPDPYGPYAGDINPAVHLSMQEFEVEGYTGSNRSWESLGKWYYELNKDRDILPESGKAKVKSLIAGIEDPREKIAVIYDYLQKNTRYVSIQLGIGGWQTFEASVVEEKGYGDCKALTTYTKGMLREAGIPAYDALIYAGDTKRKVLTDFPSSQFNHVILCVPLEQDTIWLECTSQTNPMGFIGSFTNDRHTLVVTPEGGKLLRTPAIDISQNLQVRTAEVTIEEDGSATARVKTSYRGMQYENDHLSFYLHYGKEDQKKWLYEKLDIPSFTIEDFRFENKEGAIPEADEHLSLQLNNYASVSGKRLFFKPNLLNQWQKVPPVVENREQEFIYRNSYIDHDTVRFKLPEGYHPEFVPEAVKIESQFGRYEANVVNDENGVLYIRKVEMYKGVYPAEEYEAYRDFVKQVVKADKVKIVMLSST